MIYPSKEPKEPPYSEFAQEHFTPKKRIVYCQYCKYTTETELYGAKCGQCKSFLISTIPSHFDNGELVK